MLYVRVRFYGVCAGLACQIHGNGRQKELVKREKDMASSQRVAIESNAPGYGNITDFWKLGSWDNKGC